MVERRYITNPFCRPALKINGAQYMLRDGVRAVVVHWTANQKRGAGADAHYRFFDRQRERPASAHWFVDDKKALQIIPNNEVAFHVGDRPRPFVNLTLRRALSQGLNGPNYSTIGVEMCVNVDSDLTATIDRAQNLVVWLLIANGLTPAQMVRHYDISGKDCPKFLIKPEAWALYRLQVQEKYEAALGVMVPGVVEPQTLNVRRGPTAEHSVAFTLAAGERICYDAKTMQGNWAQVFPDLWINTKFVRPV